MTTPPKTTKQTKDETNTIIADITRDKKFREPRNAAEAWSLLKWHMGDNLKPTKRK